MKTLRAKSEKLTAYLEWLLTAACGDHVTILTPNDPAKRGCQLSLSVRSEHHTGKEVHQRLEAAGVACDWREPDVIRIAPTPRFTALNMQAQLKAAIDGLGFLSTFEGYVREAVDQGLLRSVLSDWCPYFPGPFLYYPSRRQNSAALQALIDFFKTKRARVPGHVIGGSVRDRKRHSSA